MKKALDPYIKKASQNVVKKIKTNIIKNTQMKDMPTNKKETSNPPKGTFDDLRDIVSIKKQKAVANELDSMIFDQNEEKERRLQGKNNNNNNNTTSQPSPMNVLLSEHPEKIKDMSIEDVTKLSIMQNSSGNSNSSLIPMLLDINKNNNGNNGNGLTEKLLGVLIEKALSGNNNGNNQNGNSNNEIIKLIMTQNQQNQQMLMKMMEIRNTPSSTNNSNNDFMKEMFGMVKNQGDLENTFLREKLRDMEQRIQPTDSLGDAKRMMEYAQSFKGFFGGGNQTPEGLEHDLKMKTLEYEQNRQINEENRRSANMNQIGEMVTTAIGAFGKALGEPIVEAAKTKVEQFTESVIHPENQPKVKRVPKVSRETLREEIDLGDIESLENELVNAEFSGRQRKQRFKVYEKSS